jgi:DNA-binding transcriptional regulator YhcF (GntR family)
MEGDTSRRNLAGDMILHVDTSSAVPPYEQMRTQITTMVMSGVLPQGARLPAIRQLATDLGLAVNTVGRAFQELERDGILETRGRHGSFVSNRNADASSTEIENKLKEAARHFALQARHLGAEPARALKIIEAAFASTRS